MKAIILKVTFEVTVHKNESRFTVPSNVARMLGLQKTDKIALVIRTRAGVPLYGGIHEMKSRWEVYGSDMREYIKRGKAIIVEASNPK